ncbi:hypothetical protein [Garicola koreensis]|uniref:Uncharacterized membrane protein YfbV (UPF0208 family) n=1 Tax=Garicola koreensis TaxID=1262554 RepID=A0A7W5XKX8_9MICC|nr:hypothetical protein [Garicola koreensis]MBB3667475.1 uncharacterized membrane protein YfbV (UPF0208 family) [Garicola koreensis]
MPRPVLLGICFAAGIIIGIIGTALHGNIWVIGEAQSGAVLPWGAALALLILLLGLLWAGTTARSLTEPLLLGATVFSVASIAYIWPGPDQLVVPYSSAAFQSLPGPVIASLLWWLGSAAITLVGLILVKWVLAADAARHLTSTKVS